MTRLLLGWIAGLIVGCQWAERQREPPPTPTDLFAVYGDGVRVPLGSPDDEGIWWLDAQRAADERGAAVAVTQGGQLIAIIEPQ